MKNNGLIIVLIVILSFIAVSLVSFMTYLIINNGKSTFFNTGNKKSVLIIDQKYEIGNVKNIDFDLIELDVNIFKSEDEFIHIKVYDSDSDKVKLDLLEDGLLLTEEERKGIYFFYFSDNKRVDLYLPDEYKNKLILKTISGDVTLNGNYDNKFIVDTVSGDIEGNVIKEFDGQTVSGDISLDKCILEDISTTSGDVELGFVTVTGTSSISTISGDVELNNIEGVYIETNTISGEVIVNNNDRKSDNILKIKTTSGDILVN